MGHLKRWYLCVPFSSGFQVIKDLPATFNRLAIKQFLNQPENEAGLTLF
jgi:hypothetical protein